MAVTVITDSAAALPSELVTRYDIRVVPLWLHVGEDRYRDGELPLEEFVARFDEPCSTAAPSPGEFATVIAGAREAGPVVVLTLAERMSSTHQAAVLGARQVDDLVAVMDTGTAAGAQALVVLAAAEAARDDNATIDDVLAVAKDVASRVHLVATVPDLDRLASSGRVPEAARWLGDRLGVRPLFEFRAGQVKPLRPAFSRSAALERIVHRCASDQASGGDLHVAVLHALDQGAADMLVERIEHLRPASCIVGQFSPVMVAHTGKGLAGLAWWRGS
jgi:DegV family protein with EDD domain